MINTLQTSPALHSTSSSALPITTPALVERMATPGMDEAVRLSPALTEPFSPENLTGTRPAKATCRGCFAFPKISPPTVRYVEEEITPTTELSDDAFLSTEDFCRPSLES